MLDLARRFLAKYRRLLVLGPACKLIEAVFDLITPLVIARMIDDGVGHGDVDVIIRLGIVLLVMAVLGLCFTLVCQKTAALVSQGSGTDVRNALFEKVNEFSYTELDRFSTPSLVTRITNDVNQLQVAVAMLVRQVIRWPFLAIGSMVAALLIDFKLGLIFLVVTPLIAFIFWSVMRRCIPYFRGMQAKLDRISLITREALSGVRVIRAFVRDDAEERRFDTATADQTDTAIAAGRLSALLNPATLFVMDMGVVAILWAGGNQVMVGELTQGQVMAFVNYMTQTLLSIVYVANLVVIFTKASASAARVKEVLDTPVSICDGPGAEGSGCKDSPAISIQDVCFRFPDSGKDTLSHVSLEVAPGQTLGIIGGTGSGKSTLMALMQRLYDATSGSVLIRGVDVRDYRLDELRGTLAVVPQAPSLVSGTLRENLVWRDSQATDDELWHALELAQAAEFVRRMPEGLDSPVEASGKNFSGGQRQRLTIARALVGRPSILLLDDPFSALDYATDRSLRDALAADDPSRTTVMISQRVSSVREASLICVLDSGRVIGLGTHDELVDTCPVYKEICLSQLRPEEVGA